MGVPFVAFVGRRAWREAACCLGLTVILAAGCTSLDKLKGSGLDGRTSDWSQNFRNSDQVSEAAGFSEKARQIEGNLGVH